MLLSLLLTLAAVDANAATYTAAVVSRVPVIPPAASPQLIMLTNLKAYAQYMQAASGLGSQLIVFPEFALGGVFTSRSSIAPYLEPLPNAEQQNPCRLNNTQTPVLNLASCLAAQHKIHLCLNMYDRQRCVGSHCPQDAVFQYNTEVCFNDQGAFIAKYHKTHPWHTAAFDAPPQPEIVTFQAFGVTFGLFVCYDILWPEPTQSLLARGVRHFPYSVALAAGPVGPVSFTVWSLLHNSTILVANEATGSGGGVFQRGTSLEAQSLRFEQGQGLLTIAHVPK